MFMIPDIFKLGLDDFGILKLLLNKKTTTVEGLD